MAEPKMYRFKVTAPDGTTADSEIFSYAPPEAAKPEAGKSGEGLDNSGAASSNLIDVAPTQG